MLPNRKDAYQLLHDGAQALAIVEYNGIKIDTAFLHKAIEKTNRKVQSLERKLYGDPIWSLWQKVYGGKANLGSDKQLGRIIFDELGYKCPRLTPTGQYATDVEALQDVDLPFARRLGRMAKLKNTVATFLGGLKREVCEGYIHPSYNLNTVVTYRSSSSDPNSQNIPRRDEEQAQLVRSCFIPEKGQHFWEIDFKALEVNVNAVYSKDPALVDYCSNPKKDMHRDQGMDIYSLKKDKINGKLRFYAKNEFVFATLYGSYYKLIAPKMWDTIHRIKLKVGDTEELISDHLKNLGIKKLGLCQHGADTVEGTFEAHLRDVERRFWKKFKRHDEWRKENFELYKKQGYLDSLTGFRLIYSKSGYMGRNDSFSYLVQGSAFHCLLWTLIQLQKWVRKQKKMKSTIRGQIHDSMLGNSPPNELGDVLGKAKELITQKLAEHWDWICVPLTAEVGVSPIDGSWYQKEERPL